MHKLLRDFEIQTDHLISARRPDQVIIKKKKTCPIVEFAVPADHRVKLKENENKDRHLNLARELKKTVVHESDGDTSYDWCSWYSHQKSGTRTGRLGNKRTNGDHPNYSIIKIGQNTFKNVGDLERLADTQIPARDSRVTQCDKLKMV